MKVFLILLMVISCGHLPKDIHPNPALSGYHRMEFDISYPNLTKKEIGIGNIFLTEDQSLENISFKFYGVYKGTLYMKSNACGINVALPFDGERTFFLKDLIPKPMKCSIDLIAETSPIHNKQHNMVETGEIKINVISNSNKPLEFEYSRVNSIKSYFLRYSYLGQGSIQRQEGDLTSQETFTVKTGLTMGGLYRVAGCTNEQYSEGTFEKDQFVVKFIDVFKKKYLKREDTCDLEIRVIPNEVLDSMVGRFSVSLYDKETIPLENLSYEIKKVLGIPRIVTYGQLYIAACSINENRSLDNKCSHSYKKDTVYWIKAVTTNGRKSVFAVKNELVFWTE